jgi:hypothetical protein
MSVKKIIQRRGNFTELPILSSGEIGYATDFRRMFIGNDIITRFGHGINPEDMVAGIEYIIETTGTADFTLYGAADNEIGTVFTYNGVTPITGTGTVNSAQEIYDFGIPLHHMQHELYSIFKNDELQTDASDYVVLSTSGIKFTASLATSDTVVLKYNTEIPIKETATSNVSPTVPLVGNISEPKTIDETTITRTAPHNFNYHYTISNAYGFRKGILSVSTDGTNITIDDSFSINATTNKLRHIFSGTVTPEPNTTSDVTFKLSYTTFDIELVNFSYRIDEEYHHHT